MRGRVGSGYVRVNFVQTYGTARYIGGTSASSDTRLGLGLTPRIIRMHVAVAALAGANCKMSRKARVSAAKEREQRLAIGLETRG